MRKHDVRKWLHAVLDLLPVILIPVFMIYSHRHTIDSGSIDVPQNQVVDFNQQIKNPLFENNFQYWDDVFCDLVVDNDYICLIEQNVSAQTFGIGTNVNIVNNHKYLISLNCKSSFDVTLRLVMSDGGAGDQITFNTLTDIEYTKQEIITASDSWSWFYFMTLYGQSSAVGDTLYLQYPQIYDLTQMFGSGNEPTIEQFNTWYSDDYYDYILSHKELLKGTSTITYDDTDIMSQVVYQLYNSVDKYFNMGNVFNLTGVYDWFNLNIFNGNAPISIYIVWNIVLYEFVMDLLFLLYGLFMWFIDMVEKLMEKPLKSVK